MHILIQPVELNVLINNLPGNLLKILSGEGPLNLSLNFIQNLKIGQTLKGKVTQVFPDGKANIQFGGQKVLVDPQGPVAKGQALTVRVEKLSPAPILKMIPSGEPPAPSPRPVRDGSLPFSKPEVEQGFTTRITRQRKVPKQPLPDSLVNNPALKSGKNFSVRVAKVLDNHTVLVKLNEANIAVDTSNKELPRPGSTIIVRVNQKAGELELVAPARTVPVRTIEAGTIKPYLSVKQPFGEMVSRIEKMVTSVPLVKELNIDPGLVERLRQTLKILLPRDTAPTAESVKQQIDSSGLRYESKLKAMLLENDAANPGKRMEISNDLKGQVQELRNKLEARLPKEGNPQTFRQVSELAQTLRHAADNIELQQLTNQLAKQENQPLMMQLPNPFSQEDKTIKLYFRNLSEDGQGGKGKEKDKYNLVFFLDLTALGAMRIDALVQGEEVKVKINVEHEAVAGFIDSFYPELQERMREIGFNVTASCCVKEADEIKNDDTFHQLMVEQETRLVDIET